jgi:cell division transport system ATP-binding protein
VPASDVAARCDGVSVDYRTASGVVPALRDVDADFARARFSVLAGASGSGKSSLLRVLAGLKRPSAGRVAVDGTDLSRLRAGTLRRLRRTTMGIVLQDPADNLVEYLPAVAQVELAARLRGADRGEAAGLLDTVGLASQAGCMPHELSGGEQQRVAIARAFVNRPMILLADEPTGNLDPTTSVGIMKLLDRINRTGTTVVMATHDAAIVDQMRKRVIELETGKLVRDQSRGVYGYSR